jgi:hypothetical protein
VTPLIPLLESSDDELERALLLSARADAPGQRGLHETALALGLAVPTAKALAEALLASDSVGHVLNAQATSTATSAVTSLGTASVATIAKYLALGTFVSFFGLATLDKTLGAFSSPAPAPTQRRLARAAAPPALAVVDSTLATAPLATSDENAEPPVVALSVEPESVRPKHSAPRREPSPSPAPVAAAAPAPSATAPRVAPDDVDPPAPSAPAVAVAAPSNASLAAEIRLLDRTRAALSRGDAATARQLLQTYRSSRPSGVLAQEADLLQVQLLLMLGDRRAAADLARKIIVQHPGSTHANSLRNLAAEP